ncbi:MAG: hypothetical protein FRX49_13232 [Trebouxia sp. A1-2]|nr:MAG: hypothetical protein FRX49_13232 [Trebouxia sp. A1-2]
MAVEPHLVQMWELVRQKQSVVAYEQRATTPDGAPPASALAAAELPAGNVARAALTADGASSTGVGALTRLAGGRCTWTGIALTLAALAAVSDTDRQKCSSNQGSHNELTLGRSSSSLSPHSSSHALQLSFDSTKLCRELGQLLFRLLFVFAQSFQSAVLLLQLMGQGGDLQLQNVPLLEQQHCRIDGRDAEYNACLLQLVTLLLQVGFLDLVHELLLILLTAQAVAQLLSSLKARLVSLGGSLGCSLQISPEARAQLLQAGVFTLQGRFASKIQYYWRALLSLRSHRAHTKVSIEKPISLTH